ncbi:MAG: protein-L-isoaspartate(D-aspartate) O-methyltransferase [Myxococcota bacterium]
MADRTEMVRTIALRGVSDAAVLAAVGQVDRSRFVPEAERGASWEDRPLPIGLGQTISQPYVVAWMLELGHVRAGMRVLDVGTGSGYQAAVLAALGARVYSVELLPELAARAADALRDSGFGAVEIRVGDGKEGWPEHAPYDAILVAAAPQVVPPALIRQLAPGGRLVIPVGSEHHQEMVLLERPAWGAPGAVRRSTHGAVAFVPLV